MKPVLALDGGAPVRRTPFPSWPFFDADEQGAALEVLRSGKVNYWTGDLGRRFEQTYAASLAVPYAIALANGTLALELALRALGIGPGDEVITSPRTFIASASCIVAVGARPVMADVDLDSQLVTPGTIEAVITSRTKVVIPVHLAGWPCEMDTIMDLAERRGLWVVEDCAQAHGATYHGRPVGSWGHMAAFSFCQDKIITTGGEGGLLALREESLFKKAWAYKDHGKDFDRVQLPQELDGRFRWVHASFGTNWRLTEFQAAIGLRQLEKLPGWVARRRSLAARLTQGLADLRALRVPVPPEACGHAYYKFYAFVRPEALRKGWDRDRVLRAIRAEGVPVFSGSCPEIYLEDAFPPAWRPSERFSHAKSLGETSLMFLVHPTLELQDIDDVLEAVRKVFAIVTAG